MSIEELFSKDIVKIILNENPKLSLDFEYILGCFSMRSDHRGILEFIIPQKITVELNIKVPQISIQFGELDQKIIQHDCRKIKRSLEKAIEEQLESIVAVNDIASNYIIKRNKKLLQLLSEIELTDKQKLFIGEKMLEAIYKRKERAAKKCLSDKIK